MSIFVLDTSGDQELKSDTFQGKRGHKAIYYENANQEGRRSLELGIHVLENPKIHQSRDSNDEDEDFFGLPPPSVDISKIIQSTLASTREPVTKTAEDLTVASEKVDNALRNAKKMKRTRIKRGRVVNIDHTDIDPSTGKLDAEYSLKTDVAEELKTSNLAELSKQLKEVPKCSRSKQRVLNKIERSKTKGAGWFNMPATEVTDEVRNELKIIQMRSVLDPKHFYKKNDLKVLPKYFQIGTVQHSPLDYYHERHTRKTKQSLVDQLLADEQFQAFNKRKYKEVFARTNKYAHRKAMQKMKKLKRNKK